MAKNRQDIPRAERVREIIDRAAELFSERDFGEVSMAEIAERVGIRPPAIYWYFESKEHLLAAVLRHLREQSAAQLSALPTDTDAEGRLIWYLAEYRPMRLVHASAHARARLSPAVAEAHDSLMAQFRELVDEVLQAHMKEQRRILAGIMIALFEGVNDPGYKGPSATEIMTFVLDLVRNSDELLTST